MQEPESGSDLDIFLSGFRRLRNLAVLSSARIAYKKEVKLNYLEANNKGTGLYSVITKHFLNEVSGRFSLVIVIGNNYCLIKPKRAQN
jgi:hypothetical protein